MPAPLSPTCVPQPARPATGRGARPTANVLLVTHRVPYPPDKGDRIRTFHLLQSLATHATIHLACLADEPPAPDALAMLGRHCGRVAIVPLGRWGRLARTAASLARGRTATEGAFWSNRLASQLAAWASEIPLDACLLSSSALVPYLRLDGLCDVPAVVDMMDVDSQKWLDYAAASRGPRAWLYRTEARRLRRLETMLPPSVRAVTVVSETEAALYRRFFPTGPIHAIPNGVDLDYFQPRPGAEERTCVFVGALDYRPNVEGVCWLARAVWPRLRGRYPDARLLIVGRRPAPAVQALAGEPGIELVGQVADVRPQVARAAVAVVPLQIARGVQNKLLEALAMGKAAVASPTTLQGVRAEPGRHLLAAASADEWLAAMGRLFEDAELRARLGQAGRRFVEEEHRWEQCLEPFGRLIGLKTLTAETEATPPSEKARDDREGSLAPSIAPSRWRDGKAL